MEISVGFVCKLIIRHGAMDVTALKKCVFGGSMLNI